MKPAYEDIILGAMVVAMPLVILCPLLLVIVPMDRLFKRWIIGRGQAVIPSLPTPPFTTDPASEEAVRQAMLLALKRVGAAYAQAKYIAVSRNSYGRTWQCWVVNMTPKPSGLAAFGCFDEFTGHCTLLFATRSDGEVVWYPADTSHTRRAT